MRPITKNWGWSGEMVRCSVRGAGLGVLLCCVFLAVPAVGLGAVAWSVHGVAEPSLFSPAGENQYELVVSNVGSEPSTPESGELTLVDRLPGGLTLGAVVDREGPEGGLWSCSEPEPSLVSCTYPESLRMGEYAPSLGLEVSAPAETSAALVNDVEVSGAGATVTASTSETVRVGTGPQSFGITEFSMEAREASGEPSVQAGGHPWQVTASLGFPWNFEPANSEFLRYGQVENVKKVTVELPEGMVGNVLSTEHCTQVQLFHGSCPSGSRVGTIAVAAGHFPQGDFQTTTNNSTNDVYGVYNIASEPGYPAVFGFTYTSQTVYIYATVVHSATGNRVRLTTVGVPPVLLAGAVVLTLWGKPGVFDNEESDAAFITNPTNCSAAPDKARLEVETWESPGVSQVAETTLYKELTGCGTLQAAFTPGLVASPLAGKEGTTQADSPSGFQGTVIVPQTTGFEEDAVPDVKDVSATLPAGVSLSPSGAQGLVGCQETGPDGINMGTSEIGQGGRDLGNPAATEFGAGHAGGNNSPYDDSLYHTAPGHCPKASEIGSLEVFTPLEESRCGGESQAACEPGESPAPIQGHVYLATPKCGGAGQSECIAQDAEDGTLLSGYAELSGNGVLIKERATIQVDQATGRITVHLKDISDFPFSELKLRVHGGQRAAVATPQVCGTATTTSSFTSWSSSEPFAPTPSSFTVDADGAGGECPTTWPFSPGFTAGSINTTAGAVTGFTATLTRKDREQDPTSLTVAMPLGLVAMLSNVTPCPEPDAAAGTCPASSLIGHDTAGAGSGSEPYYVHGDVYLTGPYKGAPFGLSVVTPAAAGPFNLGNIVVRSTINVNPATAQVTVASDPIPQTRLGIPLRLKALNITVDRGNFVINPTNCSQQQVAATTTGDQGTTASLSSPFAVTGCVSLPSKPVLKVTLRGHGSKHDGADLTTALSSTSGQANIKSVKLDLPKQLPSRLATLQKACVDTVFNTNPAACPAGSTVGSVTVRTPILKSALTGPAILVSHGGAAFPDLVFVLQGEGVTIDLDGNTDIKHGVTSETFKSAPDAPFTSLIARFPQGPDSILGVNLPKKAKFSFCGEHLTLPLRITAQNNATTVKSIKATITGCKPLKHHKARHARR